jgi:hypothetical protein
MVIPVQLLTTDSLLLTETSHLFCNDWMIAIVATMTIL